jgi:hypothetical protein
MKTAVEWLRSQIVFESVDKELLARWDEDSDLSEYFEQALQMEKEQLLQMSLKSAHYERKWILEHSTESKYNPSKVEIRDLEKTAFEHYNETFKQ